jgi:serine protease Do
MIQVYMDIKTRRLLWASLAGGIISGMAFMGFALFALNGEGNLLAQIGNEKSSNPFALAMAREETVVDVVNKAQPAVVSISAVREFPSIERSLPYDGLFDQFSDDSGMNGVEEIEVGGGSGFFVTSDGYIVTNKHVVEDEYADYLVTTNSGGEYKAEVVLKDPDHDVAVLKIEGRGYPYLKFGDSSKIEIGQSVIAIGNALGEFKNTVSVGIISGLERSIVAGDMLGKRESLSSLIQTDAAINHGNSGGPLLDMRGNVIGVNVAVASMAQNISFALPANDVKGIIDSLR